MKSPVIQTCFGAYPVREQRVKRWIFLPAVVIELSPSTSAISGGAQSARRLLITTHPRRFLSLQAA
jgi:hypothetical protein